ncbi:TonB family protein [Affinibrenneria salicis]|uniref:TonB family protein n=1 Tax=Affinibrenneria salicis TaxID=2590031 RepID=A0A5J5FRK7_9GAMM|nr:TonB family protein [Affinibrenneria salicis]KAA8995600.1 TonB family protein [Affinibrenneria salicis]
MKKLFRNLLLVIAVLTLIFPFWPEVLFTWLVSSVDRLTMSLLPSSVDFRQRNFFVGLWAGALVMSSVMLIKAWRDKLRGYMFGGLAVVAMAVVLPLLQMPLSEEANRRRLVMQKIEGNGWENYRINKDAMVNHAMQAVWADPSESVILLRKLDSQRLHLSASGYSDADVAAAKRAWAPLVAGPQALDEDSRAAASKTLAFYSDWLLTQPEPVIASALLSVGEKKSKTFIAFDQAHNALLAAPLSAISWRAFALMFVSGTPDNTDLQRAMASLMIARHLPPDDDLQELNRLLGKVIDALPEKNKAIFNILDARAQEDAVLRQQKTPSPQVAQLAAQPLPLTDIVDRINSLQRAASLEYPGKVTIINPQLIIDPATIEYPDVGRYIERADVVLSVDTDPEGRIVALWVQQGSGESDFDQQALAAASTWRFASADKAGRQVVRVRFESSRMSWLTTLEMLARGLARFDQDSTARAEANITRQIRSLRNMPFRRHLSGLDRLDADEAKLQAVIEAWRALPRLENNNDDWAASVAFLHSKAQVYGNNREVVLLAARFILQYYHVGRNGALREPDIYPEDPNYWQSVLEQARTHFAEGIALNPERIDGWIGWGISWLDEDAELAAGAFAQAARLRKANDFSQLRNMMPMYSLLKSLRGNSLERYETLKARMEMRYMPEGATPVEAYEYISKLTPLALSQRALPMAQFPPQRTTNATEAQNDHRFTFDFVNAGVQEGARILPPAGFDAGGIASAELILQLDVAKNGAPAAVMIKSSSGYPQLDSAVIAAAYFWRFPPRKGPWITLVPVQFRHQAPN